LPSKNKVSIGKKAIFVSMRVSLLAFFLFSSVVVWGQKFRFNSGVGTSVISWYENQATIDFSANLSFQNPTKNHKIFVDLKTMGNISGSPINKSKHAFIEPPINPYNEPFPATEELLAHYRGGQAEVGIMWNKRNKRNKFSLLPSLSLYSRSIARKISSTRSEYIEEEKYALHGISAGMGLQFSGKTTTKIQAKVFEPFYEEVTLYGRYVGVPFQSLVSEKLPNYKFEVEFTRQKFGVKFTCEVLNLGGADNKNSKSIQASNAIIPSTLLTYFF
jgi:hypothetical protein